MSFLNRREERDTSASLLSGPTTTPLDPAVGVWLKMPPTKQLDAPVVCDKVDSIEMLDKPMISKNWMPAPTRLEAMVNAGAPSMAVALMGMRLMPAVLRSSVALFAR